MNQTPPPSIEVKIKSIQQLIQTTKFSDAIKQSEQLLATTSDKDHHVELWYLIAVAQRYAKDAAKALTSINNLLKINKNHSRANQEQGYIYLALKEATPAKNAFKKAVSLNPCLVASWQELIQLYRVNNQKDQIQDAANQLEKLKKLPPALLAVTELMHEGKWLKAEQICRHFLLNNKKNIDGMCLLAEIGIELKVYDDAEFLLASALELAPSHTPARSQYLNLLIRLGKYKAAKEQVEKLLNKQPDNLSFKVAKASVLSGLGDLEQAITLFKEAINEATKNNSTLLKPQDKNIDTNKRVAGFYLQLGHALKAKGDISEAITAYQKAYQINPSYGDAFWSLANTKTYHFSDNEIAHMQSQQHLEDLALLDKIQLLFATGKAFEDKRDYDQAFSCYQQGNTLQHTHSGFDISKIEQQVAEQIKHCTDELFLSRGHLGLNSPDPIFIVGLPRAGSTLLEQILASHSQVDGTMELHNILGLASRLKGRNHNQLNNENQYPKNLAEINPDYFKRFGQQFIDDTQVYRDQAPLFIDKMPNNFLHIGLIRLILPNAKIIDARRSPLACCFSGFKQLFAEGQDFSYSLDDIGRYYQSYLTLMAHWDKVLPGFILTVNHEDVVDDLETQVRRMLDFCGLAFEQSCLDFHKTKRTIKTPSSEQVRQPIYKSATEQWQYFEQHLGPLKKVLNNLKSD